ncbi:MAG: hypothetical protein WC878_04030 [Candidatus Paceibacterota bacterium]|jgi:hypothetical protein
MGIEGTNQKIFTDKDKQREFAPGQVGVLSDAEREFFEEATQPFRTDKLYDTHKLNGEPNKELFKIVREIEERLLPYRAFIGLAPFGSQTKGYSVKDSDFDIHLLADNSDSLAFDKLETVTVSFLSELRKKENKDGGRINFEPEKIDMSQIYDCLEQVEYKKNIFDLTDGLFDRSNCSYEEYRFFAKLAALSYPTTGHRVEKYRSAIKDELNYFTQASRENILSNLIDFLVFSDSKSIIKMIARSKEIDTTTFDAEAWLAARKKLWTKRVHKIYG